jgi:hypothetical protein
MAVHRRVRKAAHNALAYVRGRRKEIQRRRKGAGDRGEPDASTIDKRLSGIAKELATRRVVSCPWELFRVQHFPGWEHEEVAAAIGQWSRRQGISLDFETREVNGLPVIYVLFGERG